MSYQPAVELKANWDTVPKSPTEYVEQIANKLAAAKAVLWRGRGELPQRHWKPPRRGLWLVIDLWGGIATTVLALLALGMRVIVLHVDTDRIPTHCVMRTSPHLVHVHSAADVCQGMFAKICKRRKFEACLVGGGSPWQGNTFLNPKRKGFEDERSQQPMEVQRIAGLFGRFQL